MTQDEITHLRELNCSQSVRLQEATQTILHLQEEAKAREATLAWALQELGKQMKAYWDLERSYAGR